jgi:hypothetical protein
MMFIHKNYLVAHLAILLTLSLLFTPTSFAKTVTITDTGINMLRETIELPDGWRLDADIAINPSNGQYVRFKHDIIGPEDEMLRQLPEVYYGILTGRNFQQTWQLIIEQAISDFMDIESIGQLIQYGPIAKRSLKELGASPEQTAAAADRVYEVTVTGSKKGKPYVAVLVIVTVPFDGQSGMIMGGILGSPAKRLDETINTSFKIEKQTKLNPAYDTKRSSIIDNAAKIAGIQHQQRMQNNQQLFNQNQQMVKQRSQAADQRHQQWMNNFNQSTPTSNSTYSSDDAYIDSIHETSTFADPDSGQNKTIDGQYQYNYTDGMGNYYGTDNPGFNPGSLPNGDWQETQPLQPQY